MCCFVWRTLFQYFFVVLRKKCKAVMIPRIKQFELNDNWKLLVTFDDGFRVCYDVKDDIDTIEDFKSLITEIGLWSMAQLDSSRTCITWDERIDLPSDTIYEYGVPIRNYEA